MKSFFLTLFLIVSSLFLQAQIIDSLPDNMYADSIHAPFYHGVTSGDPLSDRVIIWTRRTPDDSTIGSIDIQWKIATDSSFTNNIKNGVFTTSEQHDWTVKIDVANLKSGTTYYYQFTDSEGNSSAIGRTRTLAKDDEVEHLRLAVFSCSSIYSGYFNAYKRVAEREDLDLVIHLGDYIYDFVDGDEEVRVPKPYPQEPTNLREWRDRHLYHLLDPDLRAARQQHPWMVIWDNHDTDRSSSEKLAESVQAFLEYVPIRENMEAPEKIYRDVKLGNLVDLVMIDVLLFRDQEEFVVNDTTLAVSILGEEQDVWLKDKLQNSTGAWRIIGNQKVMGGWLLNGNPLDEKTWDGFQDDRNRLFDFLVENNIQNNLVLSGDSHVSLAMDLVKNAFDTLAYNSETGEGAIGVELLPTSITRGNFDESGVPETPVLNQLDLDNNPNHVYADLFKHGYGILDIK